MKKRYYVYLLTNLINTVIYTGITGNLVRRVHEHKQKLAPGFTRKYNVNILVYFEIFDKPGSAILREKQLKAGSRKDKINLIRQTNPSFTDLYCEIV